MSRPPLFRSNCYQSVLGHETVRHASCTRHPQHTILVITCHILTLPQLHHELGAVYFDQLERQCVEQRLVRRLEWRGSLMEVTIEAVA